MKKNDLMGYLAYAMMLAIALCVALLIVRPIFDNQSYLAAAPMNGFGYVVLAILAGILFNSLLLEFGHLIGAHLGKFKIYKWNCLGFSVKTDKDGKKKAGFSDFAGLTGETDIYPTDVKKSNPRHFIYLPLFFFLLEAVLCVVLIVFAKRKASVDGELVYVWMELFLDLVLCIGGMIFLYDIFPTQVDGLNDGYLLNILVNDTNKEAYNQMLLTQYQLAMGQPVGASPVYDKVTDFTAQVNDVTIYLKLAAKDYKGALEIVEKTIACKSTVSSNVYQDAVAEKTGLLFFTGDFEEAKKFFIALPLDSKKHIAALGNITCVRAYVLASGLVEESLTETQAALEKAQGTLKKLPADKAKVEKEILGAAVDMVLAKHADWDLLSYGYGTTVKEPQKDQTTKDSK
jgi:hypothetical protein